MTMTARLAGGLCAVIASNPVTYAAITTRNRISPAQMPVSAGRPARWANSRRSTAALTRTSAATRANPAIRTMRAVQLTPTGPNLRPTGQCRMAKSPAITRALTRLMNVAGFPGAPGHAAPTTHAAATPSASQYPILRGMRPPPSVSHIQNTRLTGAAGPAPRRYRETQMAVSLRHDLGIEWMFDWWGEPHER